MNQSPVSFESTTFPEINIVANPSFKSAGSVNLVNGELDSQITIEAVPNQIGKYAAELRVRQVSNKKNNLPYFFDILCLVVLTVDEIVPENERNSLALRAAHSMAFPAIRELILSLTARQPWGQFSIGLSTLRPASEKTIPPKPVLKKAVRRKRVVLDKL